jgi:benzodiazapine receptor
MMPKESMNLLRQIGVLVAVIATIIVNVLANVLPFNGVTTGELAAQFDVLFVPAPYVFAIWTVIYLGLAAYAVYQVQPSLRDDERLRSLDLPFLLGSVANMSWLLLWHFQFYMATFVVMLVLLGSLITIYRRLDPERATAPTERRWAVHHGFSLYLGWITIAAMANFGVVLDYVGWTGGALGETTWFTLGVLTVLGVAGFMAWLRTDVVYLLTLIWAFVGIGVERAEDPMVSTLAWTATAVLAVMVALSAIDRSPEETDLYMP